MLVIPNVIVSLSFGYIAQCHKKDPMGERREVYTIILFIMSITIVV